MNVDEMTARALERLDARVDPPPPPVLPEEEERTALDIRLVVTEHTGKAGQRLSWKLRDTEGKELHSQEALGRLFLCCAELISRSQNWHQYLHRAAKKVLEAAAQMQREAGPPKVRS